MTIPAPGTHLLPDSLMRFCGTVVLIALCLPSSLIAQNLGDQNFLPEAQEEVRESLRFDNLSVGAGLSQGSVYDIFQDSRGFMWFSTQDGLNMFDGYETKVFESELFDSTSLASSSSFQVDESADGYLWVSAVGGGLNRLDPNTAKVVRYEHDETDSTSIGAGRIRASVEDRDGRIWTAADASGISILNRDTGTFERIGHIESDSTSLASERVYDLYIDADGIVWAGTWDGLSRIDPETREITNFLTGLNGGLLSQRQVGTPGLVAKIKEFPEDPETLWLGTGRGIVRFSKRTGETKRYVPDPSASGPVLSSRGIAQDPNETNVLWVATAGSGLARFDKVSETFHLYKQDQRDSNGLINNVVWEVETDETGIIWVGTDNGLSRFNPASVDFLDIDTTPHGSERNPATPWGLTVQRDGTVWIGVQDTGAGEYLIRIDGTTGARTTFDADNNDTSAAGRGQLWAHLEAADGTVWIGSGGVLSRYIERTGKFEQWRSIEGDSTSIPLEWIYSLAEMNDGSGRIWVGTYDDLYRFDPSTGKTERIGFLDTSERVGATIASTKYDSEGTLWIHTNDRGLTRQNNDGSYTTYTHNPRDTTSIPSGRISEFTERSREPGVLWLATSFGLARFDKATGRVTKRLTKTDGMPNNNVYGTLEDDNGNIWYSTNNGIGRYNPDTGEFRNYGLDSGLLQLEYMEGPIDKSMDGTMYFGHVYGVTVFNPARLRHNPLPPAVALSDFKIRNKSVVPGPDSPLKQPLSKIQTIELGSDENVFSFDFVALHYGNPAQNQYAYRLDGWDDEWNEVGHLRTASYTNLPAGNYTFRVKASNSDRVWNEVGRSVNIIVHPPWWKTWWAYLLYLAAALTSVFGITRVQKQRMAIKEGERTKILEAQLKAEAQSRRREDAEKLSEIGRAITSTLSVRGIIDTVYENVNALMDASVFAVGVLNEPEERIDFPNSKEQGQTLPTFAHDLSDPNRLSVYSFTKQEDIVIGDYVNEYKKYIDVDLPPIQGESPSSILYLPLVHQGKSVGVITAQSFAKHAYSDYHLSVLRSLASYAAIALDNADAYRKLGATIENLKAAQARLVQSEKMASLGEMTAGIAHEIKNPLNFVNNFAELNAELAEELAEALRNGDDPAPILDDIKNNAGQIQAHGKRADSIVRAMMQHASGGAGHQELTNVNPLVEEYIGLAYHGMRASTKNFNVELVKKFDDEAGAIPMVPQEVGRVLLNLLGNAFYVVRERANQEGQDYKPTVTITTKRLSNSVEVRVTDNGSGIPEHVKERIFEPFFTTKPTGSGTGLGLSLSYDIVTKGHGGEMTVESEPGEGAEFIITLPLKDAAALDNN